MTENLKPDNELHWLAFRYVASELAADEEAQFETRLADDQAAREAVECAFELQQALWVVAAESLPVSASGRAVVASRIYAWTGVAAACLLFALAWSLWPAGEHASRQAENREGVQEEAATLAIAWTEVHDWQTNVPSPVMRPPRSRFLTGRCW
jgi:hypothetical protein